MPAASDKVQLNVTIDGGLSERLKAHCQQQGKTVSAFVSQAIERLLEAGPEDLEARLSRIEGRLEELEDWKARL